MIKIIILSILFCFVLGSTSSAQNIREANDTNITFGNSLDLRINDRLQMYFHVRNFNEKINNALDTIEVAWFSQHLLAMKEPVLLNDTSQFEIYRFTWLRSFHHPIAIRIERHAEQYVLYWKECKGAGGYDPGKLIVDQQKIIDKATWHKFKHGLHRSRFWKLDTNKESMMNDGAEWIMEAKKRDKYHLVVRQSPKQTNNFYKCGNLLIELTDLKIREDEKY